MIREDDDLKDATRIEYGSWSSEKVSFHTEIFVLPYFSVIETNLILSLYN